MGAGVSLFLLLCILLVIKVRCRSSKIPKKENGDLSGPTIDSIEKDPDIIPHNEGKNDLIQKVIFKFSTVLQRDAFLTDFKSYINIDKTFST